MPNPMPRRSRSARRIFANVELIVVIFLGIVSVATAYTSFQSGLYGGHSDDKISQSEASGPLAESLYLEGNQQYVQDAQTVLRLAELNIDAQSADPVTAADAAGKYDEIYFIGGLPRSRRRHPVGRSSSTNREPDFYHYPRRRGFYLTALFSAYEDEADERRRRCAQEGDQLGAAGRPARRSTPR